MKITLHSALFLCLFMALGCKKDKNDSLKEQIVGRWKVESISEKAYVNDQLATDNTKTDSDDDDFIEFKDDGTISASKESSEDGSVYTLDEAARTITIRESGDNTGFTFNIARLDNVKFYFGGERTETVQGVRYRYVEEIKLTK